MRHIATLLIMVLLTAGASACGVVEWRQVGQGARSRAPDRRSSRRWFRRGFLGFEIDPGSTSRTRRSAPVAGSRRSRPDRRLRRLRRTALARPGQGVQGLSPGPVGAVRDDASLQRAGRGTRPEADRPRHRRHLSSARSPTGPIRASRQLNPGKQLPRRGSRRSPAPTRSGDTYAFTSYLTKVSPGVEGQGRRPARRSTSRPARAARATRESRGRSPAPQGRIGYISVAYAVQNKLGVASIQNAAGQFVPPGPARNRSRGRGDGRARCPTTRSRSSTRLPRRRTRIRSRRSRYAIVPEGRTEGDRARSELLEYALGPGQ